MNPQDDIGLVADRVFDEISQLLAQSNALRSLLILVFSVIVAYFLSHFVGKVIIKVADKVAVRSDSATDKNKALQLRRVETYLSVAVALVRAFIVGFVAFFVWQALSPAANLSAAAIGAGAFFIVIAGATIGMLLRDITAGSAMIAERWYNVGDFIRVEPFLDVSGVVEKMSLRSTKLRSLNGEVIWMHNQHMQAVKVTEGGVRTLAIDIFVKHEKAGKELIADAIGGLHVSPMTITAPIKIVNEEKWAEDLWSITVVAQTPPGREWLIEQYFVDSLKELDRRQSKIKILARQPIVRHADPAAERSFRRAVRS
jgi:hypothetical protein